MVEAARDSEVTRGREAYERRAWQEAFDTLSRADSTATLELDDLDLLATSAFMLGRDDVWMGLLERAHDRALEAGAQLRAARCAIWLGMHLAVRGEMGSATGWLGRSQRLLDEQPGEHGEAGYLLLPMMFRHEAEGDFVAAAAVAGDAAAVGRRFDDADLFALALHGQGHMLVRAGETRRGFALLDEAMLTAMSDRVSPMVTGLVYCGVILACRDVYEAGRAREWTEVLSRWCEEQPDMIAFTGRCLVHRAEVLQLSGSWADALAEAQRASRRFAETHNQAVGLAQYRAGELLRLQGRFAEAEASYRNASASGWEPQPGLAQLRLAQGRADAASSSIARACAETADPLRRAGLLPAYTEIMLAAGEQDAAREACRELEEIAQSYDSAMLGAMVAYAGGAVALADGDAPAALRGLRDALQVWIELDAPYEIARTRALVAGACRALGDEDAAVLELELARDIFERLGAAPDLARVAPSTAAKAESFGLSPRELEVLRLVATGRSNRQIASELVISEHTVARHVQNIFAKLGLSSRTQATAFAFEHGLS
jgi:DNA-binding CsgD family transcriptional regulator